jgi:hypothetical protein
MTGSNFLVEHALLTDAARLHQAIDYRTKDLAVELDRLIDGNCVSLIADSRGAITGKSHRACPP